MGSKEKRPSIVKSDIEAHVGTIGNEIGLCITLASAIMQDQAMKRITVWDYSSTPMQGFYLRQLAEMARLKGIEFVVRYAPDTGIANMYRTMAEATETKYLWILNDDVAYDPSCLLQLIASWIANGAEAWAVCGSKPDVTNIKGYKDFTTAPTDVSEASSPHRFYFGDVLQACKLVPRVHMDFGNILIDRESFLDVVRKDYPRCDRDKFVMGDDWLLSGMMADLGYKSYLAPLAIGIHLEKPNNGRENPRKLERNFVFKLLEEHGVDTGFLSKEWAAS